MLRLEIATEEVESYDERTNKFVVTPPQHLATLDLEHSLVSLSKWEAFHKIPFLSSIGKLTPEQIFEYLKCMIVTPDVDPHLLVHCTQAQLSEINDYINSTESATTFRQMPARRGGSSETITAELIYYWMVAYKIPFEPSQNWHLNKLFSLIKISNVKNSKPKRRSPQEMRAERAQANAERREMYGTRG